MLLSHLNMCFSLRNTSHNKTSWLWIAHSVLTEMYFNTLSPTFITQTPLVYAMASQHHGVECGGHKEGILPKLLRPEEEGNCYQHCHCSGVAVWSAPGQALYNITDMHRYVVYSEWAEIFIRFSVWSPVVVFALAYSEHKEYCTIPHNKPQLFSVVRSGL